MKNPFLHYSVKSLAFALILIPIFSAFSISYNEVTQKDNYGYLKVFEQFLKTQPEVLFVGDSHVRAALCHSELGSRYFDLSRGSDSIRQMLLKLDYAISKKPNIRYLVLPLDYHNFSEYRYSNTSFADDLYYTNNFPLIAQLYHTNIVNCYRELLVRYIPLLSARNWEKYTHILLGKSEMKFFNQEANRVVDWPHLSQAEKLLDSRIRANDQLKDPIIAPELVAVLDQLIAYCQDNNIKIIGIKYPLTRELIQFAKQYDIEKVENIYQERKEHFLAILDYRKLFIEHPEHFWNTDHLSLAGAKVFTRILKKDIEERLAVADNE